MSKTLDELTDELLGYQKPPGSGPDFDYSPPPASDALKLAENNGVRVSDSERTALTQMGDVLSGSSFSVLNLNLDSSSRPPVSAEAAAQALAAGVNAASGGTLIPAGFEVKQDFNMTVQDYVRLDLLDSYIKFTSGATQYNHKSNVTIEATDVHLKAGEIAINADEEKNTVHHAKKLSRYFNLSSGSYSLTETPWKNRSALLASGDLSLANASVGGVRIGTAAQMSHYGSGRHGGGLVSLDNEKSKWEKSANMVSLGATVIWLILSGG